MVSHDSCLFNYLSFGTHRISVTGEERVLDAPSLVLYVHVCFWESAASPKTCLRVSTKSALHHSDTNRTFQSVSLACAGRTSSKRHHTDYFVKWLPSLILHINSLRLYPFKYTRILIFILCRLWVCWDLLHLIKANWLLKVWFFFFLSVAEIRAD